MLHEIFRTKEAKIITVILGLTVVIIWAFLYQNYKAENQYEEQTVMADEFLKAGDYEQAVEAYLKALAMKNSDQEYLTIGLAEAYAGVKDFDKALEVLRDCYQKTAGVSVKEKIEDITSRKTDYEYLQIISRADKYFTNKEYNKAVAEYEKAKLIKSKEVTPYRHIAEAYIGLGEYDLALEEVQEGLALTESKELDTTLELVNSYLLKQQYDTIVADAAEYIYQENYEDGINKYLEAIKLMPGEVQAYSELAQTYLNMEEYQKAATLLEGALMKVQVESKELNDLYAKANEFVTAIEERKRVLSELYEALDSLDVNRIFEFMNTEVFKESIADDAPVYYSPMGEGDMVQNYGMIIYDSENIYYGQMKSRVKAGSGLYFMLTPQYGDQSYYYYLGEWNKNVPNGAGKTAEETTKTNEEGKQYSIKIVTEGTFYNGAENGSMHKYFYAAGEETGNTVYSAHNGIPIPMTDENGKTVPAEDGQPYAIGILYENEDPTGLHYYYAEPNTYWGVKPFIQES